MTPLDGNASGTPAALIAALRQCGDLAVLDEIEPEQVLIEFPFAADWQEETGCARFVRLREEVDGARYALVRAAG